MPLQVEDVFNAVAAVHRRVKGSYAVIALIAGHGLLAFRDPHGIRPMCLGRSADGTVMVGSESVALEGTNHVFERDVQPGEAVFITPDGTVHARQCAQAPQLNPCIFEFVYLARPDSVLDGISVYQARLNLGEALAKRVVSTVPPNEIDVIIPIPESSRPSATRRAPARHPVSRGLRQEPLRGPHLHHAGAGRAQEVGAPEAQCDRQRIQGPQRAAGGRLHRARHDLARDRADGPRRRRAQGVSRQRRAAGALPQRVRYRHAHQQRAWSPMVARWKRSARRSAATR